MCACFQWLFKVRLPPPPPPIPPHIPRIPRSPSTIPPRYLPLKNALTPTSPFPFFPSPQRPANEEDDNSSESSGAIPSIPPDLHLEDLSPEELRFTTSYPDPDSATKVILSPRSRQAVSIADVRKLDEAHARIRTMRVLYQSRLRYKVWKVGRKSGNLTVRWLEIKMSEEGDPKEVVLRKRRGGDAESDEDDVGVRFSKLSNLRVKWGDENGNRCLRAEVRQSEEERTG